jgi:hypothetical protein
MLVFATLLRHDQNYPMQNDSKTSAWDCEQQKIALNRFVVRLSLDQQQEQAFALWLSEACKLQL